MTTIKNRHGEDVTLLNVTRVFTYDVETIVNEILTENRAKNGDIDITIDDVVEYIMYQDFVDQKTNDLIVQDQDGNDI